MTKRMTITVIALAVIFGGLLFYNILRNRLMLKYMANFQAPAMTISAHAAETEHWQPYLSAVGNFVAVNSIEVSSEVAGIIEKIYFNSGEVVKTGDLLVKLDDTVDQADLRDNLARLDLARVNYERQQNLAQTNATSAIAVDESHAEFRQAEEAVGRTQAYIDKKYIKAPFDGKLGIRSVSVGEYISPGATRLVTLQSLDPIYIRFFLPEQNLQNLYIGQPIRLAVDAYPGEVFTGEIHALESRVDEQTHNIEVQAIIANEHQRLYPGVFANVQILLPREDAVITVPDSAVTYSLYGDSVYVVREDETLDESSEEGVQPSLRAYRQYITVGEHRGARVAVISGIKVGELIVDSGQLKLTNGVRVKVNNEVNLAELSETDATDMDNEVNLAELLETGVTDTNNVSN